MIIVVFSSTPVKSVKEAAGLLAGLPCLPDYIALKGHYSFPSNENTVEGVGIYEVRRGMKETALKRIEAAVKMFSSIPGFEYRIAIADRTSTVLKRLNLAS